MYGFIFFGLLGYLEGLLLHHAKVQFYMYTYFPARMKKFDHYQKLKQDYIQKKLEEVGYRGQVDSFGEFKRLLYNLINKPEKAKQKEEEALNKLKKKLDEEKIEDDRISQSLSLLEQQMEKEELKQRKQKAVVYQELKTLEKEKSQEKP